jgi:hypothetical protein
VKLMNCFQCERSLSAYLDDELPMDERLEVETHVDGCGSCRSEFDSQQAAWEAAQQSLVEAAPDGLWRDIEDRLREQGRGTGVEDLTLIVKGLAGEVGDLRRTVEDLQRLIERTVRGEDEYSESSHRDPAEDIRVPVNPFRPGRPREARLDQLRRSS